MRDRTRAEGRPIPDDLPRELGAGTLPDIFFDSLRRFGDFPATRRRLSDGSWESYTRAEFAERIRRISAGLRALGYEPRDHVAILSTTRMEWSLADWASLLAGLVVVTVYPTLPADQVRYVLGDSGARLVFLAGRDQLAKVAEARIGLPQLERVVCFEPLDVPPPEGIEVLSLSELAEMGYRALRSESEFEETARRVRQEDVATLIYTSGTTGTPKGVELTHGNLHANTLQCVACLPISEEDVVLSWLPLCHAFERTAGHFVMWAAGVEIAYADSLGSVARDMGEVRPTLMIGVPRMFEKFYDAVVDTVQSGGLVKKGGFRLAKALGDLHSSRRLAGREPGLALRAAYSLSDRIVFSKLRERTGGRVRYFVSGAAPLSAEIARFFYSGGLTVLEGYGLTEASPVTNVNPPEAIKFGTVGPAVPGTEIRIAGDGEILVRGPQVMKGYYRNPKATAEALDADGWLRTGDIGSLDADGYLTITDRKKNIIVTAAGKNIAPQPVEERIARSPYVEQVVMLGDRQKFPIVMIVPSFQAFRIGLPGKVVTDRDRERAVEDPALQRLVEKDVLPRVASFASYERPKKVLLVAEPFTVENGLLTPTLKVRRKEVSERYADRIEAVFGGARRRTGDRQ